MAKSPKRCGQSWKHASTIYPLWASFESSQMLAPSNSQNARISLTTPAATRLPLTKSLVWSYKMVGYRGKQLKWLSKRTFFDISAKTTQLLFQQLRPNRRMKSPTSPTQSWKLSVMPKLIRGTHKTWRKIQKSSLLGSKKLPMGLAQYLNVSKKESRVTITINTRSKILNFGQNIPSAKWSLRG